MKTILLLIVTALGLTLAGCGGGGTSTPNPLAGIYAGDMNVYVGSSLAGTFTNQIIITPAGHFTIHDPTNVTVDSTGTISNSGAFSIDEGNGQTIAGSFVAGTDYALTGNLYLNGALVRTIAGQYFKQ